MRRGRRRFAAIAATAFGLTWTGPAAADDVSGWTATRGPFAWEAKRLSCGVVGEKPSRVRAHTRWRASPANGYMRLVFVRQVAADGAGWVTVQRQARSTRNGPLEGSRRIVHWSQWFFPFEDEAGATTRHRVVFEWRRDRAGRDRLALRRVRQFAPCVLPA
ncbi:MAG TPA: hypothetical protein VFR63_10075 [Gaiellaceae bacterium]|nr:hypothetical protein [Gaiellaceae bacterium]